jgi:ABC-type dipeptide/oligopeptide/nickel transport system ATPase component/ABC-type dipeptide/oligopeptide/nickel transport system permease subunit
MTKNRKRTLPSSLIWGLAMFGVLVVIAIVAPIFLSGAANTLSPESHADPSSAHWFGTDDLGRDIIARSLVATRLTILMSLGATALSVVVGVLIGGLVWVGPRRLRETVLRIIDSTVAFPALILALVIAAILGPAASSAVIAIGVAGIPSFARITANMVAPIVGRDFMNTSKLLGVPPWQLFTRHLLPNIGGPLLVLIASSFALSLLEISSLSFVGLGVQSPDYDWGRLLNEGLPAIYSQPLQVLAPSVMLIFAGVAAMLTGDGLAQRFDPWGNQPAASRGTKRKVSSTAGNSQALVEVKDLTITATNGAVLVKEVSFDIVPGEIVGLVGESGSGKSMTAMALAQLNPDSVTVDASLMRIGDLNVLSTRNRGRLAREIGLVYQDPGTTFNPALRIGTQVTEVARVHLGFSRPKARDVLVEGLRDMRFVNPELVMQQRPFQLSGGMLQRAIIASSLVTDPRLIIADEPTTALDVTVQAEVLRQFKRINREKGAAILFISHDIGVVQALCDRVLVMKRGEIVERLTGEQLATGKVSHPYTRELLAATPKFDVAVARPSQKSGGAS